ncbi:GMC family oxidoreductase [Pseudooceanicola nanhaiensis]|uniref:GMC family oxidoreductase n=1 Tax=Pseudooceanicola nanhaiensis TaxID=375761 RepID=UPI001CD4AE50|nr:GMC family oxidoreductase N-terminal domain-containing protein [Pseudooceanicola nanhaiensis]MCA0920680.1 GMC family oxidoreductase N-terminal domain-containing protein [Pseudooceanicola nanhaiensis]
MSEFDYIIVGAGSAGCVLANRLSADPAVRVALIEAGGTSDGLRVKVPAGILSLYGDPQYDYGFTGVPQPELNNRELPVNRGKALGGSSAINSMIYIRGHAGDYDDWAALGCTGWGYDDVLPVFRDLERNLLGQDPAYHGTDGELLVDTPRDPNPVSRIFVEAAKTRGMTENSDFNGPEQEGVGIYDVTQDKGSRFSAYRAYVEQIRGRANLSILTGAESRRLVVEGGRVTGVVIRRDGTEETLTCRGEVVLSAGAIGSPALLLASGIGPGAALKEAGRAVTHDLPGVGQNLRDHIDGMITTRSSSTKTLGLSAPNLPAMIAAPFRYVGARRGMLTTNYVEAGGFARTKYADARPDIQFHFVPGYRSHRGRLVEYGHGYAIHTCVLRPGSVGELRPKGGETGFEIDHRFFTDEQDAKVLIEGIKIARDIFAAAPFDAIRGKEMLPGEAVQTDDEILAYLRAEALTVYHPVGTCKMGSDPMAVVDPEGLRVRGIANLRVADASVMPTLIGGNTNAPSMMIGERAARAILAARKDQMHAA